MRRAMIAVLIMAFCGVAIAGWLTPIISNNTGTTYSWTNSTDRLVYITAIRFSHATATSNTVNFYHVTHGGVTSLIETTGSQTALQTAVVNPSGNGQICVQTGEVVRVIQAITNANTTQITLERPE